MVIGNPPWGAEFLNTEKAYLKKSFVAFDSELESYIFFIEKSHTLLGQNGHYGMIIPSNLFTNVRYNLIRKYLLENVCLSYLLDLGSGVFEKVAADSGIIIYKNKPVKNKYTLSGCKLNIKTFGLKSISENTIIYRKFIQEEFLSNHDYIFNIYTNKRNKDLIQQTDNKFSLKLRIYSTVQRGIEYGYNSAYVESKQKNKKYKPIIAGRCFGRYTLRFENKYVNFNENNISNFKKRFIYENEKIFLRRIGKSLIATYDKDKYYNVCDVYNILMKGESKLSIKFVLSLLNSKFISFYYTNKFSNAKRLFPKIPIKNILQLPIPKLDLSKPTQKAQHDKMVQLVEQMLDTQKKLHASQSEHDRKHFQQKVDILDKQIDMLVYELYELTPEEIKIVEGKG